MAEEEPQPPFFYANVMQAHVGAFDFTINFGHKTPEEQDGTAPFTPICVVGMSVSHAKTMIPILAKLIAAYEQQFGAVPAPGYEEQSRE